MSDILNNISGGELIPIIAIVGGIALGVIAVLSAHWRALRVAEMEANLKQQMLDKGMSAAEIVQVMSASTGKRNCSNVTSPPKMNKAKLVETLAENGHSGEDIERIIRALNEAPAEGRPAGKVHGADGV